MSVPYRTILVPTDFSSHSEVALEHAVALARAFGAKVHLLHCYSLPIPAVMPYDVAVPETVWEGVREAADAKLAELGEKVAAEGIEVETHLSRAFPAEVIAETAEEIGADVIVMGTRGNSGLKHVLLGSVTERVLRTAPCPVLTLRRHD